MGPLVLGDGAKIGDRAQLRESIVFPGTEIAAESILIGAIAGHSGILQSLRRQTWQRGRARRSEPFHGMDVIAMTVVVNRHIAARPTPACSPHPEASSGS